MVEVAGLVGILMLYFSRGSDKVEGLMLSTPDVDEDPSICSDIEAFHPQCAQVSCFIVFDFRCRETFLGFYVFRYK